MTYCVGMLLEDGLVMASDSRTNAGVDRVSTFGKMHSFSQPGERVLCLMSAGNLSVTQAVVSLLEERLETADAANLHNAPSLFEAARLIGDALRDVYDREGSHFERHGVAYSAEALFGGQIKGQPPRLFRLYSAGNFIEACRDTPYFQIGEIKYGKPILDRIITPQTGLAEAARCALISFDSTMRANISVGPPIDLLCYRRDSLVEGFKRRIEKSDPYWTKIRHAWNDGLKQAFANLPEPDWQI